MKDQRHWRATASVIFALILVSGILVSAGQRLQRDARLTLDGIDVERPEITAADCTFLDRPEEFRIDNASRYAERSSKTARVTSLVFGLSPGDLPSANAASYDAATMPRRNLIDNYIFDRMAQAGIQPASLTSDAEFLRRVTLDLTGRVPTAAQLNTFLIDPNPAKRDLLVDSLIGTSEFVDKWTMFFGDLYKNNSQATNVVRYTQGRDAFYLYIKDALATNKAYNRVAQEIITATGDSFIAGATNWAVGGTIMGGPTQDTYDGQAVNVAGMFMGVSVADCLLCHDGPRHLDTVNYWGWQHTRMDLWGLSSYFARVQMQRQVVSQNPMVQKYIVSDLATGDYRLNTTTGNRSARSTTNGLTLVNPKNPFITGGGTVGANESRRQALARQLTGDIQFSRAIVNYVWEKFMVEGFVSPSNSFDMSRLDPKATLPAAWSVQPTNPDLLNGMAVWFQSNGYDLRALMGMIAKSNAYQLSSTYPGTWKPEYVPYYARKYVRRMDAEEIHDAIQTSTGILSLLTLDDYLPNVQWAMQLPEPRDTGGRTGGLSSAFLSAFGRGDRDQNPRRSDGSLLQGLNMMNSQFVMTRVHNNNAGSRVASLLAQTNDPTTIIRLLFQNTLSRNPTAAETALFLPTFQGNAAAIRTAAENLQWVLLNKLDFVFNY